MIDTEELQRRLSAALELVAKEPRPHDGNDAPTDAWRTVLLVVDQLRERDERIEKLSLQCARLKLVVDEVETYANDRGRGDAAILAAFARYKP